MSLDESTASAQSWKGGRGAAQQRHRQHRDDHDYWQANGS